MKLPNFRLYDTQARFATYLGLVAAIMLPPLAFFVFRHYRESIIWYHPNPQGLARFRVPLIYIFGAASVGVGLLGGLLGFNSLGQKRNDRQGLSWLGLALGALSVTLGGLMLFAWLKLKEAIIT